MLFHLSFTHQPWVQSQLSDKEFRECVGYKRGLVLSFTEYFLSTDSAPGTVAGAENTWVNKTNKDLSETLRQSMHLRTLFHFPTHLQRHRAVWGEGGFAHHSHPLMVPTGPNKGPQEKIRAWSLSEQFFGSFGNYRGSLHPREPVCFLFSSHLKVIRIFFHLGGFTHF